jgi:hypothetical protein
MQGEHPDVSVVHPVYWDPEFGMSIKGSSLGAGLDLGFGISHSVVIRGGFNGLTFNHTLNDSGVRYSSTIRFRSYEALMDLAPFGDIFHISGGALFKDGNQVTSKADVAGGRIFTLGGTTFTSNPFNPVTGTGKLMISRSTAPMVLVGFGNLIPRHHRVIFFVDMGVVFQGNTKTLLNLEGSACDSMGRNCTLATAPAIQTLIRAQEQKINQQTRLARYYPVISLGLSFGFGNKAQ